MGLHCVPRVFSRFAVLGLCMGTGALSAAALLVGPKPTAEPQQSALSGRVEPPTTATVQVRKDEKRGANKPQTGIVALTGPWQHAYRLAGGETVEITVHLEQPAALPANGRIAVEWTREGGTTQPTSNWRKVLHALDSDVYLIYRAPAAGVYTLHLQPVTDEEWVGTSPRWRERGNAPELAALSRVAPWPAGTAAPVRVAVRPIALAGQAEQDRLHTIIACEPNDTPEQAQPITLTGGDDVRTWEVTGGADDAEYFDNGKVGQSGEDWFRLDYTGTTPHLLTAQLSMPNQAVAARLRFYRVAAPSGGNAPHRLTASGKQDGGLSLLTEMTDGQDENERAHQQDEPHRASICRLIQPGESYYLRVEANAPGYQLQLRTLKPAPYDDPRMAVRQGIYTQIGQVDAWLTNRPRGASIERRIRDSGNLLGTQCMSCHTQSGVWGPAVPFTLGYRPENVQNFLHLVNVMYECLRPTNQIKDAANNTSLAPLDLGDGPAGTRAAGFNVVNAERWLKPGRLHSMQQVRTANFVLNTSDPGGINAAGPGSNIGFVIVNLMSTEILKTAWEKTGDPKYFRKMEEKARQVLAVDPQFTDDVALRLDYYGRVFPIVQYADWQRRAERQEAAANLKTAPGPAPEKFVAQVRAQMVQDEARLRAIQNADGSWGFNPGATADGGKTWKAGDTGSDPSPTALGLTGLTSLGYGKEDPAIAKGVKALLAMQKPPGRWNKAAQTGFVTTAYALHALARLYPVPAPVLRRTNYLPLPLQNKNESLLATVKRVQALALTCEPKFTDLLLSAALHASPLVRYWAMIGLGTTHTQAGVSALARGLGDPVKMVREAAIWGMRQTLLDDWGWNELFAAYDRGNDTTRAAAMQTLGMRADAVLSGAHIDWPRLTALFDRAMNRDPHPGVRAWATKAAWQWWVWNPPVRKAVNAAWLTLVERPEPNALVENSNRYSSQALFIVNGHKANGSGEHQYKELAELFGALSKRLDGADTPARSRLAARLVGVGATFYTMSGGDGGPGQMGYVTANSGEMMGKAALIYLADAVKSGDLTRIRIGLEGGANVPHQPLTAFLVNYSLKGPEEVRQLAASAISDPRSVSLAAVPELVEPQLAQIQRGAQEPPRRAQVSDPIIDLWAKVNWTIPKTEEQQRAFFDLIIPRLDHYVSQEQIAAITDPAQRAVTERDMNAAWYLADRLGEVLQLNPDLHQEIVFRRYFPAQPRTPLEAHYWLRSVEWLLAFNPSTPPSGGVKTVALEQTPPANSQPDPALIVKDHALQLYLDALKPTADPRTRAVAIRMANRTALRTNPEVVRALSDALKFEKDADLRNVITNVLKQGDERFLPDLIAALKAEKHPSVQFDAHGEPVLTVAQKEDIVYFRDYVIPEMTRQKRSDQQSCMGCHGLPGRVPSMYLHAPDKFGYLPVTDLLVDYRTLQKRVNLSNLERSKFLRKPLNIQDGKEDGHQGAAATAPPTKVTCC
jgi:hypothetical protein